MLYDFELKKIIKPGSYKFLPIYIFQRTNHLNQKKEVERKIQFNSRQILIKPKKKITLTTP